MSEQIENLDANAAIQEEYLLLHALQIGAIDFRQFLDKSLKWARQVPDTSEQKETTLPEK